MLTTKPFRCTELAWLAHEAELRRYIQQQVNHAEIAEDIVQEAFLRAMQQGEKFCVVDNQRAWLFQVCKHILVDYWRKQRPVVSLDDNTQQEDFINTLLIEALPDEAVTDLIDCIEPTLCTLPTADQAILRACDLNHQTLKLFAQEHQISLPAAKSRLLRARSKLRRTLIARCGVQFDADDKICGKVPDSS